MLKTKNLGSRFGDTRNVGFDKRSEQLSENEYVEMSQKFSTLTDGKKLLVVQERGPKEAEEEIE